MTNRREVRLKLALIATVVGVFISSLVASAQYVRKYHTIDGTITVVKRSASFTDRYEDQILSKVPDKATRQKISILFGAYYYACSGVNPTVDPSLVEDEILQGAIADLTRKH